VSCAVRGGEWGREENLLIRCVTDAPKVTKAKKNEAKDGEAMELDGIS
jgi:hypothetical protein